MAAQALLDAIDPVVLLPDPALPAAPPSSPATPGRRTALARPCAGCRAREARYGFRAKPTDDPFAKRPSTLCFSCFRMELSRRREVADRMARGWNATQERLPLADTLDALRVRRQRAQIKARHALELR
ncbi:MAG: hypothetical protein AB7G23_15835 [Vicinamibacterales bacterium]